MEEKSMKKTYTTRNNNKHSMEKPKGLHEAAAVSKKSPRNSYDIEVHPISFHGCSVLWDSDSDLGSKSREKKAYPLPQPSASSCRASKESHQRGSSFGSERVSVSSFTSNESSSSDDDDDIHGDFSSFRVYEENNSNLWSKDSNSGSKASYMHQSPRYLSPWDASLESPTEKHPCHRLPLPPPTSPNKPSKKSPSKWKKGKLLGRGTFGHVYAGFNCENGTMCAVKEVKVITDDQTSKECLKQLNQVGLVFTKSRCLKTSVSFMAMFGGY
ncbi:mitogen-activated protein kinase kinase kinase YODA-like isoform X2 [Gossypium australe]|uniref:mitogen-activated protein kinase kinase kinase n=1 Tax=Gossypium australe TaxID=47621 RepID=A0A5B6WUH3_9ROSI|nr:mitogen-activated protein kinase kinase kinase YODA-like isoform X2 [Gossypium australe]